MTTDAPARLAPAKSEIWTDRRFYLMFGLGFSCYLPFLLIFDTLSAWLRTAGTPLSVISLFSLCAFSYSLKIVWAPVVNRIKIPGLTPRLGQRRAVMLVAQLVIISGLFGLSRLDPKTGLLGIALITILTGFFGATQDIAVDAWRIEQAGHDKQSAYASSYQWGTKIGAIVAGFLPLVLADHIGWSGAYAVMAVFGLVGVASVLVAPVDNVITANAEAAEAPQDIAEPLPLEIAEWAFRGLMIAVGGLCLGTGLAARSEPMAWVFNTLHLSFAANVIVTALADKAFVALWCVLLALGGLGVIFLAAIPLPGKPTRPGAVLERAFVEPILDVFRRYKGEAALILGLICVYRLSDFVLIIMNAFYLDCGFTLTEIGEIRKLFGAFATMGGVAIGGIAVARLGLMRALLIGAVASPMSHLGFAWLATRGPDLGALTIALGIDNIAYGYAGTCLITFMSNLTTEGFTATQYALFTSLYALPGKLVASQSGKVVEASAHSADAGGFNAGLKALFNHLPAGAFAKPAAAMKVSREALASGYVTFFFYALLMGVVAITLTALLMWKRRGRDGAAALEI